jgi:phosphoribosylanthranilate isomerase
VPPSIKFCGLTRSEDAAFAVELGADYLGVILADSPRRQTPANARAIFDGATGAPGGTARRVGVFGNASAEEVALAARAAGVDVVQLHGDPSPATVELLRQSFAGEIWAAVHVTGAVPMLELFEAADGIVLDTFNPRMSGGTGQAFDWHAAADSLANGQRPKKLILAGGLRPTNVAAAIKVLRPDVVDVSSGVESSTGKKDHALMRDFARAVAAADTS